MSRIESSRLAVSVVVALCIAGMSFGEQTYTGSEVLPILERVGTSWRPSHALDTEVHMTGTTSRVQEAVPGKTLGPESAFNHGPHLFEYYYKNGKWRFEQPLLANPDRMYFTIYDGEKVVEYVENNVLRYHNEKSVAGEWSGFWGLYSELSRVDNSDGYETVQTAMKTLAEAIQQGKLDSVSAVVHDDGVVEVRVVWAPKSVQSFWFDTNKGHNLIKRHSFLQGKTFSSEETVSLEYEQYEGEYWVLNEAKLDAVVNDVHVMLEFTMTSRHEGALNLADELFTIESLNVPQRIYTEDLRSHQR